jgi:hypothetical protein
MGAQSGEGQRDKRGHALSPASDGAPPASLSTRDLPTIAFFRARVLLRRSAPLNFRVEASRCRLAPPQSRPSPTKGYGSSGFSPRKPATLHGDWAHKQSTVHSITPETLESGLRFRISRVLNEPALQVAAARGEYCLTTSYLYLRRTAFWRAQRAHPFIDTAHPLECNRNSSLSAA